MLTKILFTFIGAISIYGANFDPLPKSFTNNIYISPFLGKLHLHQLSLSEDGGAINAFKDVIGVRLSLFGHPFESFSFQYELTSGRAIEPANDFRVTDHHFDVIRLRFDYPLMADDVGQMVGFASFGHLSGNYTVKDIVEATGISRYIERQISAFILEAGVSFVYQFNPQWHVFLEPSVQYSFAESAKNLLGQTQSMSNLNFSASSIRLGSTINL